MTWQFVLPLTPRRPKAPIPAHVKAAPWGAMGAWGDAGEARAYGLVEKVLISAPLRLLSLGCAAVSRLPAALQAAARPKRRLVPTPYHMRYTGQWIELYPDLSLDECSEAIGSEPHFQP